jgi:uncharacterized radical SAM superfamily Fe-S cluster-containing enzyme
MSDELFAKIMDEVSAWDPRPVMSLHGTGEPTLHKRLAERIKAISDAGIYSKLVTNGSLMTEKLCRKVLEAGVSNIEFSVESLDKEIYSRIRPGLDLDEVMANFVTLCRMRQEIRPATVISWIFIIHQDNAGSLQGVRDFFAQHARRNDNIVVHPRHNFGGKFPDNGVGPSNQGCWQALRCINILYDGIVNVCCVDDYNSQILGDVNKSTISEIYNTDAYRALRHAHEIGNRSSISVCASCNVPETSAQAGSISF